MRYSLYRIHDYSLKIYQLNKQVCFYFSSAYSKKHQYFQNFIHATFSIIENLLRNLLMDFCLIYIFEFYADEFSSNVFLEVYSFELLTNTWQYYQWLNLLDIRSIKYIDYSCSQGWLALGWGQPFGLFTVCLDCFYYDEYAGIKLWKY